MTEFPKVVGWSRSLAAACLLLASISSRADAPPGRYTLTADTVTDTVTALVWQRNASPNPSTWSEAQSYCQLLNLGGWSTGWRVPTIKELRSIVDPRQNSPAIDQTAFPSTPVDFFWSATPHVSLESTAWLVDFVDGTVSYGGMVYTFRVRCVH